MSDFNEVTQVGDPYDTDEAKQATTNEDLEHKTDPTTGKRLPIFTVDECCVNAEDCVRTDGLFLLDANGTFNAEGQQRAVVVHQPRTEAEVLVFREHCAVCPVDAIKEIAPPEGT